MNLSWERDVAQEALTRASDTQQRLMFRAGAEWQRKRYILPDTHRVAILDVGHVLMEGSLCMWPHTNIGWEECGGLPVINGPIYAIPKGGIK